MANSSSGKRVAILAASGVEQVELTQPRQSADDAGATTTLISVDTGEIQAMNSDINKADTFTVDAAIADVSADDFDAVILPGGTCNPDTLRQNGDVIAFVQAIARGSRSPPSATRPGRSSEAYLVKGKRLDLVPERAHRHPQRRRHRRRRGGRRRPGPDHQPQPLRPGRVLRDDREGVRLTGNALVGQVGGRGMMRW